MVLLRSYELVVLLDPKLSEAESLEVSNHIESLLWDSIKQKDMWWTTELAYALNEDKKKTSASIVCYFLHLDPSSIMAIKKEFVFMKPIMRYSFFARSSTEKYLSKKELVSEIDVILEWQSEKIRKQKHFFKIAENQSYLIDRKNESLLKLFITRFGNIKPRKYTGLSVRLQKKMREQIIRGRELWVVEFTK